MWGSDLTSTLTAEGQASIFIAVDHCSAECVGIHAARRATRFEALEPIRQGVRACFGAFAEGVAAGLELRHDHGSQFVADDFQRELAFLGIRPVAGPSSASPKATAAPSASSARSRRTCSGSAASPPSRSCARHSTPSRTPTTGPGSSSATATGHPPRSAPTRSASPRPPDANASSHNCGPLHGPPCAPAPRSSPCTLEEIGGLGVVIERARPRTSPPRSGSGIRLSPCRLSPRGIPALPAA